MREKKYPLMIYSESQEIVDQLFSDTRICDFLTSKNFTWNILTIHLTDQKLYNKFGYTLKAKVKIGSDKDLMIVRNLLYLADFMSKLKVKY